MVQNREYKRIEQKDGRQYKEKEYIYLRSLRTSLYLIQKPYFLVIRGLAPHEIYPLYRLIEEGNSMCDFRNSGLSQVRI